MHNIEMQEVTPEFAEVWKIAGLHLDKQVQGGIKFWLRAHLNPPFLEHISFRLGNQLFFIRIVDEDGRVEGPAGINGLLSIANECGGHACLMPMKKKMFGGWGTVRSGWGLIDAGTGEAVDPIALVTGENIEMSDWELQDFAVQVVRDSLRQQGYEIMSWQGNPKVHPSLWFVGNSGGPEWVVISFSRRSKKPAPQPSNWEGIASGCSHLSRIGHFAAVYPASSDDPFDPICGTRMPLYRGHKLMVKFMGLEPAPTSNTHSQN